MHIYGRSLPYMCILASVNAHLRKPKCTYTEEIFCICAFLASVNVHIWKPNCTYMEALFRKCTFLSFVNVHIRKPKCTYTKLLGIYRRKNVHIRKRTLQGFFMFQRLFNQTLQRFFRFQYLQHIDSIFHN
jgi:hypothetical protein